MKLKRSICAESVSMDRFTDRLSIFNVLDRISAMGFPLWLPQVALIFVLERERASDPIQTHAKLQAILNGTPIAETEAFIHFQDGKEARTILNFNLGIPSPGKLIFKLIFPNQELDIYDLEIAQIGRAATRALSRPSKPTRRSRALASRPK